MDTASTSVSAPERPVRRGEESSFQQDVADHVDKDLKRCCREKIRDAKARSMTRRRCRAPLGPLCRLCRPRSAMTGRESNNIEKQTSPTKMRIISGNNHECKNSDQWVLTRKQSFQRATPKDHQSSLCLSIFFAEGRKREKWKRGGRGRRACRGDSPCRTAGTDDPRRTRKSQGANIHSLRGRTLLHREL